MVAPLGFWPNFETIDVCRALVEGVEETRLVVHQGSAGTQGEDFAMIEGGKHKLYLHHFWSTYLLEKAHEQELYRYWAPWYGPTGSPTIVPQITRVPGTQSRFHTDTPTVARNPETGEWIAINTIRPGDIDNYLAGLYTSTGTFNQLSVSTRSSEPTPGSAWTQTNTVAFTLTESFEQPFILSSGPELLAWGGISEPSLVWVPEVHPTQGWVGFFRLFYRGLTNSTIDPVTKIGTGQWTWRIGYADSKNGKTGWVKGPALIWDADVANSYAEKWALPPPVGFGFRGSYQPCVVADYDAGGVHLFVVVSNTNAATGTPAGTPMTRGVIAHYFSDDWGLTFDENPNTEPVQNRTGPVLWPGILSGGVSGGGYYRTPTGVIDNAFPASPGGTGGRYMLHCSGGESSMVTAPERAHIAVAWRPPIAVVSSTAFPTPAVVGPVDETVIEQSDWRKGSLQTKAFAPGVNPKLYRVQWQNLPVETAQLIKEHYDAFGAGLGGSRQFGFTPRASIGELAAIWYGPPRISWVSARFRNVEGVIAAAEASDWATALEGGDAVISGGGS